MKRIHKERDRLLRRIARVAGLVGSGGALACLLWPGAATPGELVVGIVLCLAMSGLIVLHTSRGAVLPAIGVVVVAIGLIAILGTASVVDPPTATAMSAIGGLASASVAIPLVVRRRGKLLVAGLLAAMLAATWVVAVWGHDLRAPAAVTAAGWIACAVVGDFVDNYQLLVHPIVLGRGLPLFDGLAAERPLRRVQARSFPSGIVYLEYDRDRGA